MCESMKKPSKKFLLNAIKDCDTRTLAAKDVIKRMKYSKKIFELQLKEYYGE